MFCPVLGFVIDDTVKLSCFAAVAVGSVE